MGKGKTKKQKQSNKHVGKVIGKKTRATKSASMLKKKDNLDNIYESDKGRNRGLFSKKE